MNVDGVAEIRQQARQKLCELNKLNDIIGTQVFALLGLYAHIQEVWFEGFTMEKLPGFSTALRGHLVDQSALYGVLRKINDLGLDLVSVNRIGEEEVK